VEEHYDLGYGWDEGKQSTEEEDSEEEAKNMEQNKEQR